MSEFDHRNFYRCLSSSEKGLRNSGLNGDSNPYLCDAAAVLYQLSHQANWEQVIMWANYKPVEVQIDDDNAGIFRVHLKWGLEWVNLIITFFIAA